MANKIINKKPYYKLHFLKEIPTILVKNPQIKSLIFDFGDTLFDTEKIPSKVRKQNDELLELLKNNLKAQFKSKREFIKTYNKIQKDFVKKYNPRLLDFKFCDFAKKFLETVCKNPKKKLLNQFCKMSYAHDLYFFKPKKYLETTIKKLADDGYELGIISNTIYPKSHLLAALEKFKVKNSFNSITVSSEFGKIKPHPDIFKKSLKELKAISENTMMIGNDLKADIGGASNLGIKTIYIEDKNEN